MSTKKPTKYDAGVQKTKKRVLSVFPRSIGSLSKEEQSKLSFKPDGMAQTILDALRKHGPEAGEKRKRVFEQVKAKFGKASEATLRTQIYRGIVHLRALGELKAPAPS